MLLLDCLLKDIFPLNANTWGTVSDWVMVVVTGYTLFYLRKTLSSQLKVQGLQEQTTAIENNRFALEIMPTIKCEIKLIKEDEVDKMAIYLTPKNALPSELEYRFSQVVDGVVDRSYKPNYLKNVTSWKVDKEHWIVIEFPKGLKSNQLICVLNIEYYDVLKFKKYRMSYPVYMLSNESLKNNEKVEVSLEGPLIIDEKLKPFYYL